MDMYIKHLVSFIDLLEGSTSPTQKLLDDKITDSIAYHILAEALLMEKINCVNDEVLSAKTQTEQNTISNLINEDDVLELTKRPHTQ